MFTGIVEHLARVIEVSSRRLLLALPPGPRDWQIGESVAINGCCLTIVDTKDGLSFDVSPETLRRTSLGTLAEGCEVNLERALQAGARFGGHIVQGHVDATGEIASMQAEENATIVKISGPVEYDRYLIDKGSVTVDGISLTVVNPVSGAFDVWIIPHTLANTTLNARKVGDRVNLEYDVLARYVEKLLAR